MLGTIDKAILFVGIMQKAAHQRRLCPLVENPGTNYFCGMILVHVIGFNNLNT